MSAPTHLTLTLTTRQKLDLALLALYLFAIHLHLYINCRKACRVHRFSARSQRLYVVFSLRKLGRLVREVLLDYVVLGVCLGVWASGVLNGVGSGSGRVVFD